MEKLLQLVCGVGIVVACCTFCIWKGGRAERWGGGLILGADLLATVIGLATYPSFPYFTVFLLDFLLAGAMLVLALRFNSIWLGAAMVLQSIELGCYALQIGADQVDRHHYAHWVNLLTALMLLSIMVGTAASWRRRIRARREASPRVGSSHMRAPIAA